MHFPGHALRRNRTARAVMPAGPDLSSQASTEAADHLEHSLTFNFAAPFFNLSAAILLGSCTGPVNDNVAAEFRKNWIAAHTPNPHGVYSAPFDGISTAADRNRFIDEFLVIKDLQFHNYVAALRRGSSLGDLTADASRLVLDGLASVTGTAATKSALAAASAGITGFTGAVKKDVLFDQAVPAFIEKMAGLRANKRADITNKKKLPITEYTPSEAYADIEEYGALGTFDSALRAITVETAQSTGKAKAELAAANGDMVTAAAAEAPYEGSIVSTVVHVPAGEPPTKHAVDVNKLRFDIKRLDPKAAQALIEAGRQYEILRPKLDAEPQGATEARSYLFHMIDKAWKDGDEAALKAWRAIIPARAAPAAIVTPTPNP